MIQFSLGSVDCSVCHVRFRRLPLALLKRSNDNSHISYRNNGIDYKGSPQKWFLEILGILSQPGGGLPIPI